MTNRRSTDKAARMDAPSLSGVAQLGARGALYLLALLRAQDCGQRVAPTSEASAALLLMLDALGVVRAGPHETRALNVTAGDGLPWSYTWATVPLDKLPKLLTEYLTTTGRDPCYGPTWLRIWQELLPAEVVAYLRHQLQLHQLDDVFLAELTPWLAKGGTRHSLGQWRYACWASVRSMASVALLHPGSMELLGFTLRNEIPRRLELAHKFRGAKFCLPCPETLPMCALSRELSGTATRLGNGFWTCPPSLEVLRC